MNNMVEEVFLVKPENKIVLKAAIARILYQKNMDQSEIAHILKISQPMVSIYCKKKEKIPEDVSNMAKNISKRILENNKSCFFQPCVLFSDAFLEDRFYVAKENEILLDDTKEVVDNLSEAFLILKDKNFSELIPQVKINIAMAKENAKKSEDIASYLNGLVILDNKIAGYNGVRFGKSQHLSRLLLYLKEKIKINAIMNIAYIKNIKKTNFIYNYLTKDYKLKRPSQNVDIFLHKGDFGIEPCTYVVGKNAVEVAKKVLKIKEEI